MEQLAQSALLVIAGLIAPFIFQVMKVAGGWQDLKAQLLSYLFAFLLAGLIAWVSSLISVTWPPSDPGALVKELLAAFAIVNSLAQLVYAKWIAGATPTTGPPIS